MCVGFYLTNSLAWAEQYLTVAHTRMSALFMRSDILVEPDGFCKSLRPHPLHWQDAILLQNHHLPELGRFQLCLEVVGTPFRVRRVTSEVQDACLPNSIFSSLAGPVRLSEISLFSAVVGARITGGFLFLPAVPSRLSVLKEELLHQVVSLVLEVVQQLHPQLLLLHLPPWNPCELRTSV